MNGSRSVVILLGSLLLVLVLVLPGILFPVTSKGAPLPPGAPASAAQAYLPLVVRQYSHLITTPTFTPTPTNTPEPTPVPGSWTGTTGRGYSMGFTVSPDSTQWSIFTLTTNYVVDQGDCYGSTGTTTYNLVPDGFQNSITNNQMSFPAMDFSFTGQFTSATTATGTYQFDHDMIYIILHNSCPPLCGCYYYLVQSGTWTANGP
jgi:hypothetical protein